MHVPISFFIFCHEATHTLLFNSFLFFLLFTLCICMVIHDSLVQACHFALVVTVILFEILSMLQNWYQEFLQLTDMLHIKNPKIILICILHIKHNKSKLQKLKVSEINHLNSNNVYSIYTQQFHHDKNWTFWKITVQTSNQLENTKKYNVSVPCNTRHH